MKVKLIVAGGCISLVLGALFLMKRSPVVPQQRPNVVLISIDTLRASHMSCYGYHRPTSPRMDELARRGVLFNKVVAQSSWTLPSHMSMLTGLYPSTHTVETDDDHLPPGILTLASLLREEGYRTEGLVSSPYVGERFGFDRGFDRFMMLARPIQNNSEKIHEKAQEILRRLSKSKDPFFLFLHYLGPHTPYDPPPPFDTMFDPDYTGNIDGQGSTIARYLSPHRHLAQRDLEHIIALYDGEIAHVDQFMGALYDVLEELGLAEDTLFIITSDHGEEFKDHGSMDHGRSLYDEVLDVPWIMLCPGFLPKNHVVERQVRLIDILPTVCGMLNVNVPSSVQGVNMDPLIRGGVLAQRRHRHPEDAFSELKMQGARPATIKAVQTLEGNKMIMTEEPIRNLELYRLTEDPKELQDLSEQEREQVDRLTGRFLDWQSQARGERQSMGPVVWSEEEADILEGLGYLDRTASRRTAERSQPSRTVPEDAPAAGTFKQPRGIGVGSKGTIFVADFRHSRVQQLDSSLEPLGMIAPLSRGSDPGQLNDPCDVAVDGNGRVYVADTMNGRIQIFAEDGRFQGIWEGLYAPRGIAISEEDRRVYVAETGSSRIVVYSMSGERLAQWGSSGKGLGELKQPVGIAVDEQGNVWVAERGNARLQMFGKDGRAKRAMEIQEWTEDCRDSEPYLTFTPKGNIVLSAPSRNEILKYSREGVLLARAREAEGFSFERPAGVACLPNGDVVVSDTWNHRVVLLKPEQFVSE